MTLDAELRKLLVRAERAEKLIGQAMALHECTVRGGLPTCRECRTNWPCLTVQSLTERQPLPPLPQVTEPRTALSGTQHPDKVS